MWVGSTGRVRQCGQRSLTALLGACSIALAGCGALGLQDGAVGRKTEESKQPYAWEEAAVDHQNWSQSYDPKHPNFDLLNVCSMIPEAFWEEHGMQRMQPRPEPVDIKGFETCVFRSEEANGGPFRLGVMAQAAPYGEHSQVRRIEQPMPWAQEGFQYLTQTEGHVGSCFASTSTQQGVVGVGYIPVEVGESPPAPEILRHRCGIATGLLKEILTEYLGNREALLPPVTPTTQRSEL